MKKLALSLLIISSFANARTIEATGEYRYGPDTSQNQACALAEDRAKQNALSEFSGEDVGSTTIQQCTNGRCTTQRDTLNETTGVIKKIIKQNSEVILGQGFTSCVVTLTADVQKTDSEIKLTIPKTQYNYRVDDEVIFKGAVNKPGRLVVFNYVNNWYQKISSQIIAAKNAEFVVPSPNSNKQLYAELPKNETQSKELVVFLYVDSNMDIKDKYSHLEFTNLVASIPPQKRAIVNRLVYISR